MLYGLPISSLFQFATAFAALCLVFILWKQKRFPEVKYLIYIEITIAIWATFYALEFSTSDLSTKILYSKFSYWGIAFLPAYFYFFSAAFSKLEHQINLRNIVLISIIPVITLVLVFTNEHHYWVWENIKILPESNIMHYKYGFWFWCFYVYTFALIFGALYNLFRSLFRFTGYYRSQIIIIIIGSLVPVIGNAIYVTKLNPFPGFDWTTICFVFTGFVIVLGIYRHRMFQIVPLANKKLINTMKDGVIVVNIDGAIEELNPASELIFGLREREVLKTSTNDTFDAYPKLTEAINKKEERTFDLQIEEQGKLRHFLAKVSPILNKNGRLSGTLVILNDISSIREAELLLQYKNEQLLKEIEKNEKLIDDLDSFAHTVAHDLKNSLGSIHTSSEVILESLDDGNKQFIQELASLVQESSAKTIQITDELLKLATSGHQEIVRVPVHMSKVFEQAQLQLAQSIAQQKATIETPEKWLKVMGYAPWLEEVWTNLLSNAIKYGGQAPGISIGCSAKGKNKVKYWIKDNGDGIAQIDQAKLFQKHTRLAPDKAMGYGLGLSIVKRIIEKLNGEVGVESTGKKGEGAIFYFILPSS